MLARPETVAASNAAALWSVGFWCHHGDIDNGPAYWSTRHIVLAEMLAPHFRGARPKARCRRAAPDRS